VARRVRTAVRMSVVGGWVWVHGRRARGGPRMACGLFSVVRERMQSKGATNQKGGKSVRLAILGNDRRLL
jgi:hypothetical protein